MTSAARMYGPLERILFLKSIPAIASLPETELVQLASLGTERFFTPGTQIVSPDEPITSLFMVMEGQVRLHTDGTTSVIEPPSGLNWLRFLARRETGRRAVAISDVFALELRATAMLDLLERNPDMLQGNLRRFTGAVIDHRGPLPARDDADTPPPMGTYPTGPIDLVQRLQILEASGMWGEASMDALVTIARNMEEVRMPAGTPIWKIGDTALYGYGIRYGRIRCTDPEGRSVEVGADYGVGFFDAIAGRPRSQHAETTTEVVALRWDLEAVSGVLELNPRTALSVLALTAGQFADLVDAKNRAAAK